MFAGRCDNRRATAIARLAAFDAAAARCVRGLPHRARFDCALSGFSRVTDHSDGWIAAGLAGAMLDLRRRGEWLDATSRIALVELSSRAIKRILPRRRPRLEGLPPLAPTPSPMSFPSSHTAASVAALHAFDGLISQWVLRALAAITAFSRLYLGVHFPSDVAAGAWLGHLLGRRDVVGRSRRHAPPAR